MKRSAVRDRGREVGPGDPSCVWRLGWTLGHDLHLRTLWHGTDALLDIIDQSSWAKDQ